MPLIATPVAIVWSEGCNMPRKHIIVPTKFILVEEVLYIKTNALVLYLCMKNNHENSS
jgi:hypothetical protein